MTKKVPKKAKELAKEKLKAKKAQRDDKGQFVPGTGPANPLGRPRLPANADDIKNLAKGYSREAIELMLEIMRDVEVDAKTRLTAANTLLDRGIGKAVAHVEVAADVQSATLVQLMQQLPAAIAVLGGDAMITPELETIIDADIEE